MATIVTCYGLTLFKLNETENNIFNFCWLVCFVCLFYLERFLSTIEQSLNELAVADGSIQSHRGLFEISCVFLERTVSLTAPFILFPTLFSAQIFCKVVKDPSLEMIKGVDRTGKVYFDLIIVFHQPIRCFFY